MRFKKNDLVFIVIASFVSISLFLTQSFSDCYPPGCLVTLCLSPDTRIKTTGIQKRIADIKVGDKVISENGEIVKVKKIVQVKAKKHKILRVTFNDATVLEVSPGHPIGDGKEFNDLMVGRYLDGRMVIRIKKVPYYQSTILLQLIN